MTEITDRPDTTAGAPPVEPVRAAILDPDGRCVTIALVDPSDPFDPGEGLTVRLPVDGEAEPAPGDVLTDGGWEPAPRASAPTEPEAATLENLQAQVDRIRAALTGDPAAAGLGQDIAAAITRGNVTGQQLSGALQWGVITEGERYDLNVALTDYEEAHRGEART